jgi:hypothetical protein
MKKNLSSQEMKHAVSALRLTMVRDEIKSTTAFLELSPNCGRVVRVTRVRNQGNNFDKFILSVCEPNYRERDFLRLCRDAKTNPRRLWFRMMPKKTKSSKS